MNDDWREPFEPDEHTVALYHFDEGYGDEAHDACGDPALTLRACKEALWGSRPGFGATARFDRQNAHLLVGPANNDKLELRTCTVSGRSKPGFATRAPAARTGPGAGRRDRDIPSPTSAAPTRKDAPWRTDTAKAGSSTCERPRRDPTRRVRTGSCPGPGSSAPTGAGIRTTTWAPRSGPGPRTAGCRRIGDASATAAGTTSPGSSATGTRPVPVRRRQDDPEGAAPGSGARVDSDRRQRRRPVRHPLSGGRLSPSGAAGRLGPRGLRHDHVQPGRRDRRAAHLGRHALPGSGPAEHHPPEAARSRPEPAVSGPAGNGCGRRQGLVGAGGGHPARGNEPGPVRGGDSRHAGADGCRAGDRHSGSRRGGRHGRARLQPCGGARAAGHGVAAPGLRGCRLPRQVDRRAPGRAAGVGDRLRDASRWREPGRADGSSGRDRGGGRVVDSDGAGVRREWAGGSGGAHGQGTAGSAAGGRCRRAHGGPLRLAGTGRPADPGTGEWRSRAGAHLHQHGRGPAGVLAGPGWSVPAGDRARRARLRGRRPGQGELSQVRGQPPAGSRGSI